MYRCLQGMRYHECATRVIRLELDKISYQRRRTLKWHKYTRILMDRKKELGIGNYELNPMIQILKWSELFLWGPGASVIGCLIRLAYISKLMVSLWVYWKNNKDITFCTGVFLQYDKTVMEDRLKDNKRNLASRVCVFNIAS